MHTGDQERGYHKGSFRDEAEKEKAKHDGWFIGKFMDGLRHTEFLEVKYWRYKQGEEANHVIKKSCTIELTLILKGAATGRIAGEDVSLSSGEYVLIPSGTCNGFPRGKIVEYVEGLTIKAPSIPTAKHEVLDLPGGGQAFKLR